jgi:hypothetical protein
MAVVKHHTDHEVASEEDTEVTVVVEYRLRRDIRDSNIIKELLLEEDNNMRLLATSREDHLLPKELIHIEQVLEILTRKETI